MKSPQDVAPCNTHRPGTVAGHNHLVCVTTNNIRTNQCLIRALYLLLRDLRSCKIGRNNRDNHRKSSGFPTQLRLLVRTVGTILDAVTYQLVGDTRSVVALETVPGAFLVLAQRPRLVGAVGAVYVTVTFLEGVYALAIVASKLVRP